MSAFIYFNPHYLGNSTASTVVSVLLSGIGVAGMGVELNKLGGKGKALGIDNLGFGLLIGAVWALAYYYFPIWWVNALTLLVLLFALYAIALGLINIVEIVFTRASSIKITAAKVVIAITQVIVFVAAFLQILEILKLVP